jgi:hypothetical protein
VSATADLIAAFLEATLEGRAHREIGDHYARVAAFFAEKARDHWAAAHACLDAAERCARLIRVTDADPGAWPPGLEAEIRDALEARDDQYVVDETAKDIAAGILPRGAAA